MLTLSNELSKKFGTLYKDHCFNIAATDVYYQTIKMLNNRHKILDRDVYDNYFRLMLADINVETAPMDAFILCDDSVNDLFMVNRNVKEYEEITKRLPIEKIYDILSITHEISVLLSEKPDQYETVIDDIYIYFSVFKYLAQIDIMNLDSLSKLTPIIEHVVNTYTLNDLKSFLSTSKRKDIDKYEERCRDILFNPDVARVQKFYLSDNLNQPKIDVIDLMIRLTNNIVLKTDIYIILAIYEILSFAIADFRNNNVDDSPCAKYVIDVLSKL